MSYTVRVLRRAEREIDAILRFMIEERKALAGAHSWHWALQAALDRLKSSPDGFAIAPEDEFVDFEVRQFLFKTRRGRSYRGIFTIIGNEVRVLHVRAPGQDTLTADQLGTPYDD